MSEPELNLPASPNEATHIATQLATSRDGGRLINIYQYHSRYFAFVDDVAYPVPSAIDALEVPFGAQEWLRREADMQAYHFHMMSRPDPADLIRHYLLEGLVAKNELSFDLTWDSFREKVGADLVLRRPGRGGAHVAQSVHRGVVGRQNRAGGPSMNDKTRQSPNNKCSWKQSDPRSGKFTLCECGGHIGMPDPKILQD